MNPSQPAEKESLDTSREDKTSALFSTMVLQQTNMAFILLGKTPHPETRKIMQDIESARMFIDQLEMIEIKTRNNLNAEEEKILKQSLMMLRMAFVDAVENPVSAPTATAADQSTPSPDPRGALDSPGASSSTSPDDESRKKYSKKY